MVESKTTVRDVDYTFYIWYLIAYYRKGYYNVSFEKEAYANENNLTYLKKRRIFEFRQYL